MRASKCELVRAIDAACASSMNMRHGAMVAGGRPACNRFSGRKGSYDLSLHAEAAALQRAPCARGATIYVVRLGKCGEFRESMPCEQCQRLMRRLGVRKCVYSTDQGSFSSMLIG